MTPMTTYGNTKKDPKISVLAFFGGPPKNTNKNTVHAFEDLAYFFNMLILFHWNYNCALNYQFLDLLLIFMPMTAMVSFFDNGHQTLTTVSSSPPLTTDLI